MGLVAFGLFVAIFIKNFIVIRNPTPVFSSICL